MFTMDLVSRSAHNRDLIIAKKFVTKSQGSWVWSVLPPSINTVKCNHGVAGTKAEADRAADTYIKEVHQKKIWEIC